MPNEEPFYLQKDNIYAVPILHYTMEMAGEVCRTFQAIQPDCVAVELAETMQLHLLHAASRLPDISVVATNSQKQKPLYYMCEPCDATFEALRLALENNVRGFCIDLDVDNYPEMRENLPDPYSLQRIGMKEYTHLVDKTIKDLHLPLTEQDRQRELYMAHRLKELSLSYDRVLFVGGIFHVQTILQLLDRPQFPALQHAQRETIELLTLTEKSCRDLLAEFGWISCSYEKARHDFLKNPSTATFPPDRQKLIYQLYKEASQPYCENTGNLFPGYHLRNLMKYARNYALITGRLLPDLFQTLSSAKGCVDHNYAHEVWEIATDYPFRRNVDNLPEVDLTVEQMWGHSKRIQFHLKMPSQKSHLIHRHRKDLANFRFEPPGPFSICSYPPEDLVVERFGEFLKKKGTQILSEEAGRTIPFSTSIEDGIDTRETIRHWPERKLYVKVSGKPPGDVGSVVVIFDDDSPDETKPFKENYPWRTTWLGEHSQESDMAFYATSMYDNAVGPGISRCEYGGLFHEIT